jgi:hypothetical protein
MDSGSLSASLSAVAYGIISAVNPSSPSATQKIASGTISSAASLELTDLNARFLGYRIVLTNLTAATDNVSLYIRMSNDGGSSYVATSSYSHARIAYAAGGSAAGFGSNSLAFGLLGTGYGSAAAEAATVDVSIYRPMDAAARTTALYQSGRSNNLTNASTETGQATYAVAEAVNAIQLLFSSGNIAACDYVVYGMVA